MSDTDATVVIARAIKSEIAHPLGSMRLLPSSEEELALTIVNALEEAGFAIVRKGELPSLG